MKKKSSLGKGINSIEGNSWVFNKNVAISFDKHVRQSIPFYDLIQKYITSISEWFIKDNSIIYDLGCSTGETAKNIIKPFCLIAFLSGENGPPGNEAKFSL